MIGMVTFTILVTMKTELLRSGPCTVFLIAALSGMNWEGKQEAGTVGREYNEIHSFIFNLTNIVVMSGHTFSLKGNHHSIC